MWGFKGEHCEALVSIDSTGHVEVAISMVLEEAGNVKMATIGRPERTCGGRILDLVKTLLHRMLCGLGCGTFHVQTAQAVPVSLVICDLHQWPQ
jgi:hypothetical protein